MSIKRKRKIAMTKPAQSCSPKKASSKTHAPERPNFEAAFTEGEVFESEVKYDEIWRGDRLITMLVLLKSSDQIIEKFDPLIRESDGEDFSSLINSVSAYKVHAKVRADLAELALERLQAVAEYHAQVLINQGKGNDDSGEARQE